MGCFDYCSEDLDSPGMKMAFRFVFGFGLKWMVRVGWIYIEYPVRN